MIPGMGGMAKEAQSAVDRGELKRIEAIIHSMTVDERRDPEILNASRRRRIARGSGTRLPEVNRLIKQFGEMQKIMRQFSGGGRGLPGLRPAVDAEGRCRVDSSGIARSSHGHAHRFVGICRSP